MPVYEITLSPGIQFPVGHRFETDSLHAAMKSHVRLVLEGAPVEQVDTGPLIDFTMLNGADGSTFDEAASLNALADKAAADALEALKEAEKVKVAAGKPTSEKAKTTRSKPDGPGANS